MADASLPDLPVLPPEALLLARTAAGVLRYRRGGWERLADPWEALLAREDLEAYAASVPGTPVRPPQRPELRAPLGDRQEVWAAGVTYARSRVARQEEAIDGGDLYARVARAERPELFFKATPARVAGPADAVRIRADAAWSVPEPELALVLSPQGRILGTTIADDVSARDIEGANALYLPQAKVYDRSCALGPWLRLGTAGLAPTTTITLEIHRAGACSFTGAVTLAALARRPEDLIGYLFRDQSFPQGVVLLTGTGIVPPPAVRLAHGDGVTIRIDGIGVLTHAVEQQPARAALAGQARS